MLLSGITCPSAFLHFLAIGKCIFKYLIHYRKAFCITQRTLYLGFCPPGALGNCDPFVPLTSSRPMNTALVEVSLLTAYVPLCSWAEYQWSPGDGVDLTFPGLWHEAAEVSFSKQLFFCLSPWTLAKPISIMPTLVGTVVITVKKCINKKARRARLAWKDSISTNRDQRFPKKIAPHMMLQGSSSDMNRI